MSKYKNKKIEFQGESFDSQLELARYTFLQNRQKEGEISDLKRQVEYLLIPTQYGTKIKHLKTKDKVVQCVLERSCSYIADFAYVREGKLVVEDCKGEDKYYGKGKRFSTQTADFKIKKKLMLWVHKIQVNIVSEATFWEKSEDFSK